MLQRLTTLTEEQRSLLTYLAKDAVVDGKIAGGLWQRCELTLNRGERLPSLADPTPTLHPR